MVSSENLPYLPHVWRIPQVFASKALKATPEPLRAWNTTTSPYLLSPSTCLSTIFLAQLPPCFVSWPCIHRYGILIEQNYDGGDLDGGTASSGVPITDLTIKNIVGADAVSSSGYDVVITCGSSGCSDWTWSDVDVTGGKKYGSCTNVPSVAACSWNYYYLSNRPLEMRSTFRERSFMALQYCGKALLQSMANNVSCFAFFILKYIYGLLSYIAYIWI